MPEKSFLRIGVRKAGDFQTTIFINWTPFYVRDEVNVNVASGYCILCGGGAKVEWRREKVRKGGEKGGEMGKRGVF